MRILAIALKDVQITFRDKKALATLIAMPLILIGILGAALGPIFSQSSDLGEFKVAIVDKDGGQIAREIKDIFKSEQINKLVKTETKSESEARKGIKDAKLVAALIIPEKFSENVLSGKNSKLEIIADPGKSVKANIFKGIVEHFASSASGITVGTNTTINRLASEGAAPQTLPVLAPLVIQDLQMRAQNPLVEIKKETTEGNKELASFQYYSAGMGVMFVLFAGSFGVKSILEERNNRTLMRIMATSTSSSMIIAGKFLGILFTGFLQVLIMIIATSLIYGVHWGNSYLGIAIISFTTVFASAGMSMAFAAIAKTPRSADMLTGIGIQIMALLGGSMVPVHVFPDFIQNLSKITINRWAIQGFADLMLDKGVGTVVQPALVLVSIGLVFLVLGAWRLKLD